MMSGFDISIQIAFIVSQDKPVRRKKKLVPHVEISHMGIEQYNTVNQMISDKLNDLCADLAAQGYRLEYKGQPITE